MSKIYYYVSASKQNAVSEFIDSLDNSIKEKLFHTFEHFKKYQDSARKIKGLEK